MPRILLSYALQELAARTQNLVPVPSPVTATSEAMLALDRATRTIDGLASWSFLQRVGVAFEISANSVAAAGFVATAGDVINVNKELKFYAAGQNFQLENVALAEIRKKTAVWGAAMPTAFSYYLYNNAGTAVPHFYFNSTIDASNKVTLQLYYSKRMALPSSDLTTSNQIAPEIPDDHSDLVIDVAVWQAKEKYNCFLSEVDKSNVLEALQRFAREYNASLEEIQNINDEAIRRGQ